VCRSIQPLRGPDGTAADDEVRAAALQFVRKVSGYRQPSKANEQAFEEAVEAITHASRHLVDSLVGKPPARRPPRERYPRAEPRAAEPRA
jgi:hypothetical protein